jgi:hypothetical protein
MRKLGVVLLLLGCGVRYGPQTTKGVACDDAAETLCDKLIECGEIRSSDRSVCLDGFSGGCCGDNRTCGNLVANPSGAAECVNRIPGESCAAFDIQALALPAYCRQMF